MTQKMQAWLMMAALCTTGVAAQAQTANPVPVSPPFLTPPQQTELGNVQQALELSAQEQAKLKDQVAAALKEQEELSKQLIANAKTLQDQEGAVSASEKRIKTLRTQEITIRADLAEKQDQLSELLAGLQRLEQNPPPPLVVEPDDVLAALRGAMMFGSIVPELRGQADALAEKLEELKTIRSSVEQEKAKLDASLAALQTSQTSLGQLVQQKKQLVNENNDRLAAEKQRSSQLAAKARSLKQLLADLAEEKLRQEAQKSAELKAREAEKRRQEAALARPLMDFAAAKGQLEFPVQGQILKRFGESDGLGAKLQGLAIATHNDVTVVTPVDGKVEFAGPFRSYGQLLILNPGHGYLVLLAGMRQISADIGQSLRAGEPVGSMGEGPSSVTLLGDQTQEQRPVLYIEFRKEGEAVDSAPWWIGGMKEANK